MIEGYKTVENLSTLKTDALGLLIFKNEKLPPELQKLDEELNGQIESLIGSSDFGGEEGKVAVIYAFHKPFKRIIAVGGESHKDASLETLRTYGGLVIQKARELGIKDVFIHLRVIKDPRSSLRALAEGAELANYAWGRKKEVKVVRRILIVGRESIPNHDGVLKEVEVISEAVYLARDLANGPASEMNPETFEREVKEAFKDLPVAIRVLHHKELLREGLNGIIAVGKGSDIPPRLLIIEYRGAGGKGDWIAVVGKGVCFDAGGLDLKPANYMFDMKFDKAGASYAVGIAYAIAKLGLKVNLVVLVPLVENLPSGRAYKPLDIIRMYNGLTVEVHNTDAEGRLILADALAYAAKNYRPKQMIDLATLTGSIISALGNHAAGLFTNSNSLRNGLLEASRVTGERLWELPMWKEYYEDIKSDFADIKNVGVGRAAGAIIGAVFLSKFVSETEWAHLDIAGVSNTQDEGPKKPYYVKGATGFGVRLIVEHIKSLASR